MRISILALAVLVAAMRPGGPGRAVAAPGGCGGCPAPCSAAATQPAPVGPGPAATQPAPGSVEDWLDRIARTSAQTRTLTGSLRYDRVQGLLGDTQRRFGQLWYRAGPPAAFAAQFNTLVRNRQRLPQNRAYVFDGTSFVERIDEKEKDPVTGAEKPLRQFVRMQVAPPNAPAAAGDPLALGRGPFPFPTTMDATLLRQRYIVTLVDKDDRDPEGPPTVHLKLVPRQGVKAAFTEAHLWYLRDSLLPRKVRTFDQKSQDALVIDLTDARANDPAFDAKAIDTAEPKERGWDVIVKPWDDR